MNRLLVFAYDSYAYRLYRVDYIKSSIPAHGRNHLWYNEQFKK